MDRQINWDDLKFLVALDTFGGLKKAADQLGYSHQTVARRMRSLEKELGVRLTDKSGQRWTLTQKGKDVLVVAQQMEQKAHEVLRLSNNEAEAYSGRVGISSVSWGMDLIVLPALKEIQSKYPDLSFDLITQDEMCSIEAGDVDLALRFTKTPPQDLIGNKIGSVRLGLYGTAANAELFKKTRYADITFIQMSHAPVHHDQWFALEDAPKRTMFVNDLQTMLLAVQHGLGVALLPTAVANNQEALVRMPAEPIVTQNSAWILRHQDNRTSNKVRAVAAEVGKIGKRILAAS